MIDIYNISNEEYLEDLLANEKITNHPSGNPTSSLTSHINLTSPEVINPLSDNPTPISEPVTKSSSSLTITSFEESKLIREELEAYLASDSYPPGNDDPVNLLFEEFADELALITFLPGNDDLPFDAESDLREIEYLLNHDLIEEMDSILEDSVDKNSPDDTLVDTISEMFTDEHALDYSSPPLWDDYDDELFDLETVNDNCCYLTKGCHVFLTNITATKNEDKSKEKRLEDVPVVQEFPEFFLRTCRISTVRNEGASEATTGTYGQRLHKTKFLTLGSSGSVCKEERWVF
ncbi:hypothetical protein Tco_1272297, partial [Tanacetum coccineum]